jgi:hypothetical protein
MRAATDQEITLRLGSINDPSDKSYRADMALSQHYKLAPYHKPFQGYIPTLMNNNLEN